MAAVESPGSGLAHADIASLSQPNRLIRPQKRQHTVSQVVLRRFAWHQKISVYDRDKHAIYSKGPGGLFCGEFDQHDPATAEERWGAVESKMPRVYKLLDERRAHEDAAAVETLRDLMAIHWVRNPGMRFVHERVKREVVADSICSLAQQRDLLARAFRHRTGLEPAGQSELDWVNVRTHEDVFIRSGEQIFSDSVAENYKKVRAILARWHVQVGYTNSLDLLIGDVPVVTTKPDHDGIGPVQGVALGDANQIAMPVAPNMIVALGPEPAIVTLTDDVVLRYNEMQIKTFVRWIGCRPGGMSDGFLRQNLKVRSIK